MSEKKPDNQRISSVAPFGLRMLPDLREKLDEAAARNRRSLNAEIVSRLEESFNNLELEGTLVDLHSIERLLKAADNVLKRYKYPRNTDKD